MYTPPTVTERELFLAPYATRTVSSRGRKYPEAEHFFRPLFQRDRERVIHSAAFRRLMLKTQVLAAPTNDYHRTRLTHTLEVAQISRTIARQLGLQEDLTEAIALSHDLGHPPFGHAGEEALDRCLLDYGGFDHNLHALRIVDVLESPYPDRAGLNLSWEVREAMAFHSKRRDHPWARDFLTASAAPSLEARVVDAADSLAYDTHDLDDALGFGLITFDQLQDVPFWRVGAEPAHLHTPRLDPDRFRKTVIRNLIEWQVTDLITHTREQLLSHRIESLDHVRSMPGLVENSPSSCEAKETLELFLRRQVYRHPRVARMAEQGKRIVEDLVRAYLAAPEELSPSARQRTRETPLPTVVGDYVAGMTDRFAREEHARLFPGRENLS